jgi:hypothetical protein
MKQRIFHNQKFKFLFGLTVFFFMGISNLTAQIYSDNQLLSIGRQNYEASNYRIAEMYLFAYVQRNPTAYQTNRQFKNEIDDALVYSQNRNSGASVGGKNDGIEDAKVPTIPDVNKPAIGNNETNIPAKDFISGKYNCDDGGVYYIRKEGNEVWWFGESSNQSWSNVMHGEIVGDIINAKWADVPYGNTNNNGSIQIRIVNNRNLEAIKKTGGFGGSKWHQDFKISIIPRTENDHQE